MPMIVVPDEIDQQLEDAAPGYLQGDRQTTKRVLWAIDEFLKEREAAARGIAVEERKGGA